MNYNVLRNRMENGTPFLLPMALERINHLADSLEITQAEADELTAIARANGCTSLPQNIEGRLSDVEEAVNTIIGGDGNAQT